MTLLEAGGYKVGGVNGIRFKTGDSDTPNDLKMTMPGRGLIQHYLRRAVDTGCTHFVLEMTSEGAKLHRHRFIELNALVFTNLSPEHIESHGSFEKYKDAKLSLVRQLERSQKRPTTMFANIDDDAGDEFLSCAASRTVAFSLSDTPHEVSEGGVTLTIDGIPLTSQLRGEFNAYNILAAATVATHFGVPLSATQEVLKAYTGPRGRVEFIRCGQPFDVVVDYAHTADSLNQFYGAFPNQRLICLLGSTGGGRDTWKRPEMGRVADNHCDVIVLTNEDPYDEDPHRIVAEVGRGIVQHRPVIIMDRREAIHYALMVANDGDAVLLTGKGTDPYIMEAEGNRTPWDDARVAREELDSIGFSC
jgi:UDP-N-acetylmuramoyl-L-alanyl-D-glutamate--2,6-diaminopimelate ligase